MKHNKLFNIKTGLGKKAKMIAESDLPLRQTLHIHSTHISAAEDSFLWEASDPDCPESDITVWSCDFGHLLVVPTRKMERNMAGAYPGLTEIFKVARRAGAALIMISPEGYRCETLPVHAG